MNVRYSFAMLLALCFIQFIASSFFGISRLQAQSYTLSLTKPLIPPLTNGVWLPMRWHDTSDQYSYISLPGETFSFFSAPFPLTATEKIGVSTEGNLWFQHGNNAVIIDPFFTNIGFDSLTPGAGVRYALDDGPSGSFVLKIEYNHVNFKKKDSSIYVSFQIWLYEATGDIAIHYLDNTVPATGFYGNLSGPYVGLFLSDTNFTDFRHIAWLSGQATDPMVTAASITTLIGTPPRGMNYILSPATQAVGRTEHSISSPSIYPNPTQGTIHVASSGPIHKATIIDPLGRVELNANKTNTIDARSLPAGCHYLMIESEGKITRMKFIKE